MIIELAKWAKSNLDLRNEGRFKFRPIPSIFLKSPFNNKHDRYDAGRLVRTY